MQHSRITAGRIASRTASRTRCRCVHDLVEVVQAAAAAQLFGVVHGGLQALHVLAFGVGLELEQPEADPEPGQAIPWFLDHDLLRGRPAVAVVMWPCAEAERPAQRRDVEPGADPVADPLEQLLHRGAGGEQQVAAVFALADRVAIAEPAARVPIEVQAEAQAE